MATTPGFPEFFVAWVKTQPALTALLGGAAALRVSPWQAVRKDDTPRITHTLMSGIDGGVVRGLGGPLGTRRQLWRLACWGPTPAEARALADMLGTGSNGLLDGFLGTLGGVKVQSCILKDLGDASEPMGPASDQGNPCVNVDVAVAYRPV